MSLSHLANPKILVVDDSRINRLLLLKVLSLANVNVQEAQNGSEALEIWRTWQPNLIFIDLLMPEMTGDVAIKKIRQEELRWNTKVIIVACTASFQIKESQEINVPGADCTLRKPFRTEEVFKLLNKYLQVELVRSKV